MYFRSRTRTSTGFTLIELLVVIAIIGVLASVVLASLNSARTKARNAARISTVTQYIQALELAYDNASPPGYPTTGMGWTCLGDYDDNRCWTSGTYYQESAMFNTALAPYMPGLPAGDMVGSWEGYIYNRNGTTGGYSLNWFLEGNDQSCGPGVCVGGDCSYGNGSHDVTYCTVVK